MEAEREPTVIDNTGEVATFSRDIIPVNRQRMYKHPVFKEVYTANSGVPPYALFGAAFAVGFTVQQVKDVLCPPMPKVKPLPPREVTLCDAEWIEDDDGHLKGMMYFGQILDEQGHTQCRNPAVVEGTIKKHRYAACSDHEATFKIYTGKNWWRLI
jgi:hypothetical protein